MAKQKIVTNNFYKIVITSAEMINPNGSIC